MQSYKYFTSDNELEFTKFYIEILQNNNVKYTEKNCHPFYVHSNHKSVSMNFAFHSQSEAHQFVLQLLYEIKSNIDYNYYYIDNFISKFYISEYCGVSSDIFYAEKYLHKNKMEESIIQLDKDIQKIYTL